jgi:hypothetical protein
MVGKIDIHFALEKEELTKEKRERVGYRKEALFFQELCFSGCGQERRHQANS